MFNFVRKPRSSFQKKGPVPLYSALIDSNTGAILGLSPHVASIVFLNEITPDSSHVPGINYPNNMDAFFLAHVPPAEYPQWSWSWEKRALSPTDAEILTPELYAKSKLVREKLITTFSICQHLNIARYSIQSGVSAQETVYMVKRIQAQAFKDAGYDENTIHEYLYVLQYADFAEIPLKQAADEILFKAKLDDELLAQSELLRLRYFNKVKNASRPEELPIITAAFIKDCYNGK